ncbi:hypothetical protein [Shewanella algae]|uniref:hypothetical protein n=1 Tax=Shewanella algae TaxID=38313 RepID=UPI001BF097D7|nr:hypothetical protein [Shewanella algae]BCV29213.1 hypothetical protein TUM3811_30730 [Shewanella algae]
MVFSPGFLTQNLTQKVTTFVAIIATLLALALLLWLMQTQIKLSQVETALAESSANVAALQLDATSQANSISELNEHNAALQQERDQLVLSLKQRHHQKLQLAESLSRLQSELNQQLAEATDEHTQAWRSDHVPADALQLLQQAAHSALCAGREDPVCSDAGSAAALVPCDPIAACGERVSDPAAARRALHEKP